MSARAARTSRVQAAIAAIDDEVGRQRADGSIPAMALAVTDRDGLLVDRRYGHADAAAGRPVDAGTLFEIGSIGKTFAALVVMQLVESGRLGLDDPVVRHLPWFRVPRTGPRITIRHLLSHTAGITAGVDGTPEAAFQVWRLRDLAPGASPGRRFHYSNVGYKALGLVVAAVDGVPFAESVRRRVLEPLGMTSSEPAITNAVRPRLAVGYEPARDDRIWYEGAPLLPATWLETDTADGSIAATAPDLAALARLVLRRGEGPAGPIVSPASFEAMATPVAAIAAQGFGMGLMTRSFDGHVYLGHTGGMVGFIAGLACDLEAGLGAVVLQNGPGHGPNMLARRLIRIVSAALEGRAPLGSDPNEDPEDDGLASLTGPWHGPTARGFALDVDGGSLHLVDGASGRRVVLYDEDDGRYLVPDPDWDRHLLSFDTERGEAWHGADRYVRDGATPPPPTEVPAASRAAAGHYRSHDPWTTNFRVVPRGDELWLAFSTAPDGFDTEQRLHPIARGGFRVGDDPLGPERLRFDTVIDGRLTRAWLSGWDYYRVGDG